MRSKGQVTNQQKLSLRESLGLRVRVRTSARNVEQVREQSYSYGFQPSKKLSAHKNLQIQNLLTYTAIHIFLYI